MSASVFLDTNILIYAIEDTMPLSARTAKARAVVAGTDWMISTQVAGGVLPRYDFETPGGPTFPRRGGRLDPALETLAGECRAATPSGFGAGTLRALSDWVLRRPDPIHRATCRLQGRVFGRPEQRTGLRKPDGPQSVNGGLVGGFLVLFDEFNGFVGEAVNTITSPSRSASSFSGVDLKASRVSVFSRSKFNYSRSQKKIVVYCSMHGAINYNLLNLRRRERSPARQLFR